MVPFCSVVPHHLRNAIGLFPSNNARGQRHKAHERGQHPEGALQLDHFGDEADAHGADENPCIAVWRAATDPSAPLRIPVGEDAVQWMAETN